MESHHRRPARLALVGLVALLGLVLLGLALPVLESLSSQNQRANAQIIATSSLTPTLSIITVTAGPPSPTASYTPSATYTPSITPTPLPCIRRVNSGDSLIGLISSCGYFSMDVIPTVLALNSLRDPASLQIGQEIVIPWATATRNPNATPSQTPTRIGANADRNSLTMLEVDLSIDAFAPTATATLPPGIMWHTVQPGDNVVVISVAYNANAKVLSELNPEVDFARCEFGERFGGPECIVQLTVGQRLRVPAPSPTPTLSPTPDPNSTATPTPTATFNKPSVVSPPDRQFFAQDAIITLRWSPSATLLPGQAYRLDVEDLTSGARYIAFTQDISFVVPPEWQGRSAARHEYRWTVGIVHQSTSEIITFQTDPRLFVWQGLSQEAAP